MKMTTNKHNDDNALRLSDWVEAVAYVLFLETWLDADEGLVDLSDEMLKNLGKKWRDEWLPHKTAEHYGDCTKVAGTCMRCVLDDLFANSERILATNAMALRDRVKAMLEEYHPAGYSNILAADVEVEIVEHAGEPNA